MDNAGDVASDAPKYRRICEELRSGIELGEYKPGDRLPSEAELGARFGVSRLTVQRALRELQLQGLVGRRAGSGTFVSPRKPVESLLFGLLIPGLGETEIFEPICQSMAQAGRNGGYVLLWGDSTRTGEGCSSPIRRLCADYIQRGVSGVFFAPVEGTPDMNEVNLGIAEKLAGAGIPLVLLDRCIYPFPRRSRFDRVGIDNRCAGFRMTELLIQRGCRRPVFLGKPLSAPTVDARAAGFREAADRYGCSRDLVVRADPGDARVMADAVERLNPDGFVCANDVTAVALMGTLEGLGIGVPERMRVVGIDDLSYARHLRVPLTTLRQPCKAIGKVAIETMMSRIADPELPARDVFLDCELVERESCGGGR